MRSDVLECASRAGRYPTRPTTSEDAAVSDADRERLLARFWSKVNKTDTCWLWCGALLGNGYGYFWFLGRMDLAHRASYRLFVGDIPDGLTIDHLCRNRACVNPAHLEPVTNRENVLRGVGITAMLAARTVCKRGHALTEDNLYHRKSSHGRGDCRACGQLYNRERNRRVSELRAAVAALEVKRG